MTGSQARKLRLSSRTSAMRGELRRQRSRSARFINEELFMHLKRLTIIFLVLVLLASCGTSRSSAPPTETPGPSTPTPNIGSIDIPKTDPTMIATPEGGFPATDRFDIPPEIAGH